MPNILLVEDDKIIAESMNFALESNGFNVKWCAMGYDALSHLENQDTDIVLLDIGLPDINGFDVLRKIRKTSDIPVIIITAMNDDADIVLGLEGLGADDYVTKPFNNRVLIARIRAQLRHTIHSKIAVTPKPIKTPDTKIFEINKDLHQVLLLGQVVGLTRAECKILKYMVEHPNRVHSKEHLLSVMHDKPTGAGENTIITHIKHIRAALNKIDPDNEYIDTLRGLGYSLVL
ncbi:MAG: response regulator [Proteobacteria bacterium]|nr:response regulator [Pseudomonadota bacterium]